jgi:hypothetical protein
MNDEQRLESIRQDERDRNPRAPGQPVEPPQPPRPENFSVSPEGLPNNPETEKFLKEQAIYDEWLNNLGRPIKRTLKERPDPTDEDLSPGYPPVGMVTGVHGEGWDPRPATAEDLADDIRLGRYVPPATHSERPASPIPPEGLSSPVPPHNFTEVDHNVGINAVGGFETELVGRVEGDWKPDNPQVEIIMRDPEGIYISITVETPQPERYGLGDAANDASMAAYSLYTRQKFNR